MQIYHLDEVDFKSIKSSIFPIVPIHNKENGNISLKIKRVFKSKKGKQVISENYACLVTYGASKDIRLLSFAHLVCQGDNKTILKGEWFIGDRQIILSNPIDLGAHEYSNQHVVMVDLMQIPINSI